VRWALTHLLGDFDLRPVLHKRVSDLLTAIEDADLKRDRLYRAAARRATATLDRPI
jgi:hypothetical protein